MAMVRVELQLPMTMLPPLPLGYFSIPEGLSSHQDVGVCPGGDYVISANIASQAETRKSARALLSVLVFIVERFSEHSQQTRGIEPILFYCWASVVDGGPTVKQHRLNASCLLGCCLYAVINPALGK